MYREVGDFKANKPWTELLRAEVTGNLTREVTLHTLSPDNS